MFPLNILTCISLTRVQFLYTVVFKVKLTYSECSHFMCTLLRVFTNAHTCAINTPPIKIRNAITPVSFLVNICP